MIRREFLGFFLLAPPFSKALIGENRVHPHLPSANVYTDSEILGLASPQLCGTYFCLRNEPMEAYEEMRYEAKRSGVLLWCTSAHRDFYYQKNIWNAKYKALAKKGTNPNEALQNIMQYSALPGTSRHHWGTDIDIVDAVGYQISNILDEQNFTPEGEYQYLQYWLNQNAHRFGFEEVYTADPNRTGFRPEPWHYSYAPIAKQIIKQVLAIDFSTVAALQQCKGYELMTKSFFETYKKDYILGINEKLK